MPITRNDPGSEKQEALVNLYKERIRTEMKKYGEFEVTAMSLAFIALIYEINQHVGLTEEQINKEIHGMADFFLNEVTWARIN